MSKCSRITEQCMRNFTGYSTSMPADSFHNVLQCA